MKKILHIILILGSAVLQGQKYQDVGQFTPGIAVYGMQESVDGHRYLITTTGNEGYQYNGEDIFEPFYNSDRQFLILKMNDKNDIIDYEQIINTGKSFGLGAQYSNNLVINDKSEIFFPISQYTDSLIYRGELLSYAPDSSSNLGGVIGMDSDLNIIFKKFFPQDVFVQSVETWNDRVYVMGNFRGDSITMHGVTLHYIEEFASTGLGTNYIMVFDQHTGEVLFSDVFGNSYECSSYNSSISKNGDIAINSACLGYVQKFQDTSIETSGVGLGQNAVLFVMDKDYKVKYSYDVAKYSARGYIGNFNYDDDGNLYCGVGSSYYMSFNDEEVVEGLPNAAWLAGVIKLDAEGKTIWYNITASYAYTNFRSLFLVNNGVMFIMSVENILYGLNGSEIIVPSENYEVYLGKLDSDGKEASYQKVSRFYIESMTGVEDGRKVLMVARIKDPEFHEYIPELDKTLTDYYNKFIFEIDIDSLTDSKDLQLAANEAYKIYPNPVTKSGVLHIPEVEDQDVRLMDMNGAMVCTLRLNNERINMADYDINTGMYILEFRVEERIIGQRILIE
ncbi:MAG: T9SS type A sorting domain-containing protein [Lewinellaceae bacterium]|nr:T9SS type A sorting domain-containing protein [Lewinellaceae bacterium]